MANYKSPDYLNHNESGTFDQHYRPNDQTPVSGIYRCVNCHHEIASNKGNPLPPQNHAQHPPGSPIVWQLNVACSVNQP